ncbi:hypothetical protein MMC13_000408 [Lambiella insularis]|nr:hypothetical protein [Lambiella insularis]
MANTRDSLLDLERRRAQLEKSVAGLQKSLQHWQTWEAEYEGLKEEITGLGKKADVSKLEKVSLSFSGDLLNKKEVQNLFIDGRGRQRDASQIVGLLSRRIDYVQENVKTVDKRLGLATDMLSAVGVVMQPEARTEDGLPLTEIFEELDEDGNVVFLKELLADLPEASSTSTPGEMSGRVVDALRKAGVKDLPESKKPDTAMAESAIVPTPAPSPSPIEVTEMPNEPALGPKVDIFAPPVVKPQANTRPRKKKSVSFANDTKEAAVEGFKGNQITPTEYMASTAVMKAATEVMEADVPHRLQHHDKSMTSARVPNNESAEDAALRRHMLLYNMNEVGAIVAEMDIEDDDSFTAYSGEENNEYGSNTDEDEDEDEFGRTKQRVLDDEYRRQMLQLEQKLNAKVLKNVGPDFTVPASETKSEDDDSTEAQGASRGSIANPTDSKGGKKGVRFAETLDISEAPASTSSLPDANTTHPAPLSEAVIERAPATTTNSIRPPKKKPSKFKTSHSANTLSPHHHSPYQTARTPNAPSTTPPLPPSTTPNPTPPRTTPTGPSGRTHAETLIERPPPPTTTSPLEPDEFDPCFTQQQLAVEYHRLRNRMIQRNGGFMQDEDEDEPDEIPISNDDEAGGGRRMSRFKAARLGRLA